MVKESLAAGALIQEVDSPKSEPVPDLCSAQVPRRRKCWSTKGPCRESKSLEKCPTVQKVRAQGTSAVLSTEKPQLGLGGWVSLRPSTYCIAGLDAFSLPFSSVEEKNLFFKQCL
jgi:hypothetical protein